nr:salicylate carboxymethyltransferase-like [Ipomoea trifida]
MEIVQVLHMNAGNGEASYANNSQFQEKAIVMAKKITEEAITDVYKSLCPKTVYIADLGCSSGPNTLMEAGELVKAFDKARRNMGHQSPEYAVYLNDLPGNDFNSTFRSLPQHQEDFKKEMGEEFGPCFFAGVAGSFYGRLFPANSLHFVHSSISLHWLSQVPKELEENKGNIRVAASSPPSVVKAYHEQFECDFSTFLQCRAKELVTGGRMVLYFLGRRCEDHISSYNNVLNTWEFLAKVLNDLSAEGVLEEEKVNSFNLPMYRASPNEVKMAVEKEGSFSIEYLDNFMYDLENEKHVKDPGNFVVNSFRAVFEPIVAGHFGEGITEEIFKRQKTLVLESIHELDKVEFFNVVSMTKK